MPQFYPTDVTFKDESGYGSWDDSHYRGHLQYVQLLAARTPPVLIPDYNFLEMLTSGRQDGYDSHQEAHELLRQVLNVTGVDLSEFKMDSEQDFYSFLAYHDADHAAFNRALGVV